MKTLVDFPLELIIKILKYLDCIDLTRVSATNKLLHELALSDDLWTVHLDRHAAKNTSIKVHPPLQKNLSKYLLFRYYYLTYWTRTKEIHISVDSEKAVSKKRKGQEYCCHVIRVDSSTILRDDWEKSSERKHRESLDRDKFRPLKSKCSYHRD